MENYLGQELEISFIKMVAPFIKNKFFVDIGAEKGSFAAVLFNEGMRGALFEPMSRHHHLLLALTQQNNLGKFYPWAIAESDGERDFFVATGADNSELDYFHSLKKIEGDKQFSHSQSIKVQCRSISSLADEGILPKSIGILKTDTEGNDLFVLQGLDEINPELVVCEYFTEGIYLGWQDARPELAIELMRSRGYSHYLAIKRIDGFEYCSISPATFIPGQWGNLFFISDDLYERAEPPILDFLAHSEQVFMSKLKALASDSIEKEKVIQTLIQSKITSNQSSQDSNKLNIQNNLNISHQVTNQPLSIIQIINKLIVTNRTDNKSLIAIDVGAHIGGFSKELINSKLFESVIAFEPNPENADALADIASHEHKLTIVRCAVGDTQGEKDFYCDENTSTGSLLSYRQGYVNDGLTKKWSVPVVTLDDYRSSIENKKNKISLIKIDTQGHDLAVIQGASQTLTSDRPLVIAELIYVPLYSGQAEPNEILTNMQKYGYQLYTLFNIHVTTEGKMAYADALFIPDDLVVPISQSFIQLDNHASWQSQIKTLEEVCRERLSAINVLDAEVKRLQALNSQPQSCLKRLISWVR